MQRKRGSVAAFINTYRTRAFPWANVSKPRTRQSMPTKQRQQSRDAEQQVFRERSRDVSSDRLFHDVSLYYSFAGMGPHCMRAVDAQCALYRSGGIVRRCTVGRAFVLSPPLLSGVVMVIGISVAKPQFPPLSLVVSCRAFRSECRNPIICSALS